VGSAMAFAQVCTDLGTPARYVAGTGGTFGMTRAERKANLAAFNGGEFQVIVCCELLIEGWDCPKVECVGILRPTRQQYRYAQMVGRATRPSPDTGKADCLVVDFDWETDKDAKDLCSSVDLFNDGSLDEDVFAEAKRIAGERAIDVDPIDVLEEAEKIVRTRQRFRIVLTGNEARYSAIEYDPIGVSELLGIKLNRKYDFDKRGDNPATTGQLNFLKALGVTAPEGLSRWGASKMLDKLQKRQRDGKASARQVASLMSVGIPAMVARDMAADDAAFAIRETEILKPKTQQRLFA
jgi:superfamily II DNA/RNA helicase